MMIFKTQKNKYIIILVIISFIIIPLSNISCNTNQDKIIETKYIIVKDTVEVENIIKIVNLQRQLDLTRDSLNMIKDSIGEDLFVAKYKLGRIKYYNDIAAKGNNIIFLRGWINRVLNE